MPSNNEGYEKKMVKLLEQNAKLIKENNELLRKLYRNSVIGVSLRVGWYILIIGLPFALYFYVLEPYFTAFGSNYELFKAGLNELPGLKGIEQLLNGVTGG